MRRKFLLGLAFAVIAQVAAAFAQEPAVGASYTVGPQDVLVITSYDQPDLTGKFTVETDDTIFVQRADSVHVFGQVRHPGAYPFRQKKTTVLQALWAIATSR